MNTHLVNFLSSAYKIPVDVLTEVYTTSSSIEERNDRVLKLCIEKYSSMTIMFEENHFYALALESYFDSKINAFADFLVSAYDVPMDKEIIKNINKPQSRYGIGPTAKIRKAYENFLLNYTDKFEDYIEKRHSYQINSDILYTQFLAKAVKLKFKSHKLHSI